MTYRIRANRRFQILGVAAQLTLAAGIALAGEDTTKPAAAEAKLLAAYKVTAIRLIPSELVFSSASEYRKVLVIGKTDQSNEIDLTRTAKLTPAGDCVRFDEDGYLHPVKDGETRIAVSAGGLKAEMPVTVRDLEKPRPVSFVRDVEPILNKVGCTAGTCHGAAKGKNGFKLSLRGYDPEFDYDRLIHDVSGRRFNRADPARSLILLKPTAQVPHGGGMRFDTDSQYYRTILAWLSEGVPFGDTKAAEVERLEVTPSDILMPESGLSQQIVVVAHYSDGTARDVTREASYTSNTPSVAEATQDGLLTSERKGEAALLVRYEGNFVTVSTTILSSKPGFQWVQLPQHNYIDEAVDQKLRKLRILPSPPVTDAEFLRRVSLDLIGVPPATDEVEAFLKDKTPEREKRARLVGQLMKRPEYVDHWSLKWGDLLKSNRKFLGQKGMWRFRDWVRQSVAENKPYNQFVYELLTARGSNYDNPAANYFLIADQPNTEMETTTQLFLGVRFVCAHCHDHPFEQWTNKQYFELSAFFAQVGIRDGARSLEKVVYDKDDGEIVFPKTGRVAPAHFPYLQPAHLTDGEGRRQLLAEWLTSKNNPYFAKAIVNRVWSYFFARGIIDPVDDIRSSNPPINPELLAALTKDFSDHHFDLQHLIRTIVDSRTYQLSSHTNEWNADDDNNFSHALPRRLTAEELMDAISISTGSRMVFKDVPKDYLAEELPDSKVGMGGFLDLFGRPQRESPCECERRSEVSLKQALNLINGPAVGDAVADPDGRIARLILKGAPDREIIQDLYVATLDRPPTAEEVQKAQDYLKGSKNRTEKAQDLEWALLNSYAFLFNR
ncbi:MAG: hypothetical protein DMG27_12565 [Acidobacteria bacterium]|nr:MAG: hypothetical protein DMG27_12565 [Acidobacteriota bacterium]